MIYLQLVKINELKREKILIVNIRNVREYITIYSTDIKEKQYYNQCIFNKFNNKNKIDKFL